MKILHVIASLDPAGGGPPTVVTRLAAAQAALDDRCKVTVVTIAAPVDRQAAVVQSLDAIPAIESVQFEWLEGGWRGWPTRKARCHLSNLLATTDVAHLHGVWDPLLLAGASAAKARNVPYIVAPHGMLYPWSLDQKPLKKRLALALGYRRMLDGAAALHALNTDEQQAVLPLGLRPPVEIAPNGIFPDELRPAPEPGAFHAMHPELNRAPYVLFLSRLHPGKGLDLLAEAFERVCVVDGTAILVVAGPDFGAQASFAERVSTGPAAGRVHLVGPVYGRSKYAAMADAACFCLPSRHETFSMAVLESLACGTPVVISRSCHFSEVAEEGAGFVLPETAVAFGDALLKLIRDPEQRRRMGCAGRELVFERYTWPTIAVRTKRLYERLIASNAAADVS